MNNKQFIQIKNYGGDSTIVPKGIFGKMYFYKVNKYNMLTNKNTCTTIWRVLMQSI